MPSLSMNTNAMWIERHTNKAIIVLQRLKGDPGWSYNIEVSQTISVETIEVSRYRDMASESGLKLSAKMRNRHPEYPGDFYCTAEIEALL